MARYVDGFVVPVPKNKLGEYKKLARDASKVWLEHGALEYWECSGDDVPKGELTSFPRSVEMKRNETVVFAWILYKSRAHRDKVMNEVMADPRFADMDMKTMPFDAQRMFFGGFEVMVEATAKATV